MASGGVSSGGPFRPDTSTPWVDRVRSVYLEVREPLWRSILGWSGSRDVADEAVAEAFAQLLRRGEGSEEVRDPAAWVWRSAYRIASGDLARRRDDASRTAGLELVGGIDGSGRARASVGEPVDDGLVGSGLIGSGLPGSATAVIELLAPLSEQQRQCVVLVDVYGHTAVSAAEVLGTSPETVRTQLARARRTLRRELGRQEEES